MCATSRIGEAEGTYCCRKCEEIAHLRIVITSLKERIDNLQHAAECEKFGDYSWLRLWNEVAGDIGSGEGAVGAGSDGGAVGTGSDGGAVGVSSGNGAAGEGIGGGAPGEGIGGTVGVGSGVGAEI